MSKSAVRPKVEQVYTRGERRSIKDKMADAIRLCDIKGDKVLTREHLEAAGFKFENYGLPSGKKAK